MPSRTENKFRAWALANFGKNIYIKKMPDFKQTGESGLRGLPDYLVIISGDTLWFEVKLSSSKKFFNLDSISENQFIECKKMADNGARIFFPIYMDKKFYIIEYNSIFNAKFIYKLKKIDKKQLESANNTPELILEKPYIIPLRVV